MSSVNGTILSGLVMLVMAALYVRQVWHAYASRRWPTAPARRLFAAPMMNGENYEPVVRYSYERDKWRDFFSAICRSPFAVHVI
jgi:hypothetical protein